MLYPTEWALLKICVLLRVCHLNYHHVGFHLVLVITSPAHQMVPARLKVSCCVLNVRVRQHIFGRPLAVHSSAFRYVCCTYICYQVMASSTLCASCELFD